MYNSSIPYQCTIGKGTRFAYGGIGVIVHKKAIIGKNMIIGSNIVIGGRSEIPKLPIIEDNVNSATGAKILGDVTIGTGANIGANAVVINDVAQKKNSSRSSCKNYIITRYNSLFEN